MLCFISVSNLIDRGYSQKYNKNENCECDLHNIILLSFLINTVNVILGISGVSNCSFISTYGCEKTFISIDLCRHFNILCLLIVLSVLLIQKEGVHLQVILLAFIGIAVASPAAPVRPVPRGPPSPQAVPSVPVDRQFVQILKSNNNINPDGSYAYRYTITINNVTTIPTI